MNLFDFAYCGNFSLNIRNLANLVPEKWSFGNKNDNSILINYIHHTFSRLHEESKIIETENYAVFNTGLFDNYFRPVYAYFTKNSTPERQKWFLDSFLTQYQLSNLGINNKPERANYFENPADLVFDTRLEIVAQYDHIFGDYENQMRLPESIRNSAMRVTLFNGAIENAKRMLEANYKTAIPQYYKGKIQLLVPICLQEPSIPDLALTCLKTEDNSKYLGCTCLTLEMAYNNARLIAKPESNWLKA